MKTNLYNTKGKEAGSIDLPEAIFGVEANADLAYQVSVAMAANARRAIAHTKDRSEVSGTGKKPWRQKGTGRSRHGSRRSPIWRTGGVTHGPRNERDFSQKINRKMKLQALAQAFTGSFSDEKMLFVDELALDAIKTKDADAIMTALAGVQGFETLNTRTNPRNALVIVDQLTDELVKSFDNIPHVTLRSARKVNVLDVMRARYIVVANAEKAVNELLQRIERTLPKVESLEEQTVTA